MNCKQHNEHKNTEWSIRKWLKLYRNALPSDLQTSLLIDIVWSPFLDSSCTVFWCTVEIIHRGENQNIWKNKKWRPMFPFNLTSGRKLGRIQPHEIWPIIAHLSPTDGTWRIKHLKWWRIRWGHRQTWENTLVCHVS